MRGKEVSSKKKEISSCKVPTAKGCTNAIISIPGTSTVTALAIKMVQIKMAQQLNKANSKNLNKTH